MNPEKAIFFLNNYSGKHHVKFNFDSKDIKITVDKNVQEEISKQKDEIQISELEISGQNTEKVYLNIAIDIKNLLSLAMGRRVTFDKQEYSYSGKPKVTLKKMSKNSNYGYQIIPDYLISEYLKQTLPYWSTLTKSEKDALFVIFDYLNQTREDFIED